jgi:DNA topoisomerase-3
MLKLVISEKPSVAKSIGGVLGARSKKDGYYEGNGYIISWCVGHLLGLAPPDAYDEKYARWNIADLPILPDPWQYKPNDSTKKQLRVLKELLKRTDVDVVINACDAGREGELIFRLVYEHCKCSKPIERLWISSMEESAITEGFSKLRKGSDYDNLCQAALCRQKADWTVGMNYSRIFGCLYNVKGLSIGRVQTPTLAMIVERGDKIKTFVKEPFYTVELEGAGFTAASEKIKDKIQAGDIVTKCNGKTAVIKSIVKQEKSAAAPKLYDLTTLQREANRIFGYSAKQTLEYAQNLYEQKVLHRDGSIDTVEKM